LVLIEEAAMRKGDMLALALAVTVAACGSGEGDAGAPASETAPAADVMTPADSGSAAAAEGMTDEAASQEDEAMSADASTPAPAPSSSASSGAAPGASEGEPPATRNWMLLEFVEPVQEADLEWLRENGFAVDTVMGEKLVRGWLERPEGGPVITADARIARVSTQMR
jgi:hypothetical protein